MNVRLKKLVGMVAMLVFLALYVGAVISLFPLVPAVWWAQLPYLAILGVVWWLPLVPLIKWMNRER